MKILGLIPARGGSKGVPRKNVRSIGGKPLIVYTIEQAKCSKLLDRVILSTDDEEIASVARSHGLDVPFMRPAELASDASGSLGVVKHALEFMRSIGEDYDAVCLLQVTSPCRPEGVIDSAISRFIDSAADSLLSVRRVPDEFNPHWTFEISKDSRVQISTGEKSFIPRRQELPAAYHRDGAIYISSSNVVLNQGSLLGRDVVAFPIDSSALINIDTMDDWAVAEDYFESLNTKNDKD